MGLRDIFRQIPVVVRSVSAQKSIDDLRYRLIRAEAAAERMKQQRDHADAVGTWREVKIAELAADKVALTDRIRSLEASLSGVQEQLRQERVERARAEERAAVAQLDRMPEKRDSEGWLCE